MEILELMSNPYILASGILGLAGLDSFVDWYRNTEPEKRADTFRKIWDYSKTMGRYALYSLPVALPLITGTAAGVAEYNGCNLGEVGEGPLMTAGRVSVLTAGIEFLVGVVGLPILAMQNRALFRP